MRKAGFALALVVALLVPSMGFAKGGPAESSDGLNQQGISVWAILGYGYGPAGLGTGFGLGGRYSYPLTHESVIKWRNQFQDRFVLEPGLDLAFFSINPLGSSYSVTYIEPVIGVLWALWFNDKVAVYPKIDLGYGIASVSSGYTGASYSHFDPAVQVGVIYRLDSINLRAELGSIGLKVGVMFPF
jgi:hypothetical protein